jgi:peroxiredoxin
MKYRVICYTLILFSLFSCKKREVFEVSGTIKGAEGKTLFFEKNGLDEQIAVDSVVLPLTGNFRMSVPIPSNPEFYRLRLEKNQIHLLVESNERITVTASADSMANYHVTGSDANVRIRDLFRIVNETNSKIRREMENFEANKTVIPQDSLYAIIYQIVKDYKKQVQQIIVADPKSPVAYFAIFQKLVYNITPFSLSDKEDLRYYEAISTAWNIHHKKSLRTKQLHNLVTYGQESIRKENLEKLAEENSIGYININLPDKNDRMRSLSSLSGKIILLDFCSYLRLTPYDIIDLRDLYTKNSKKGFEIYQISFDKDIAYWKKATEKLPWICVNDSSLSTAVTYNVTQLPTNYLINKEGDIIGRDIPLDAIREYLKKVN